ncbi:AvrE-family type 3 secretion system effector [Lonsdalea quercina]|uniref:AvrE-family type 3 secretion system effector n=1 Tax=Lonsdalea quercina TaxID=71657 RepID=UPI00397582A4
MLGNIRHIHQKTVAEVHTPTVSGEGRAVSQGHASVAGQKATGSLAQEGMRLAATPRVSQPAMPPASLGSQVGRSPNLRDMRDAIDRAMQDTAGTSSTAETPVKTVTTLRDLLQRSPSRETVSSAGSSRTASMHSAVSHFDGATSTNASHAPAAVGLGLSLDKKGKVILGDDVPAPLKTVLSQTLGKHDLPFVAHHKNSNGTHHLLMDKIGRLFSLHHGKHGLVGLHSSAPSRKESELLHSKASAGYSLHASDTQVHTEAKLNGKDAGSQSLPNPTGGLQSQLSGIFLDDHDEALRLHDGKLFSLSPEGVWQPKDDRKHAQLSRQADGNLYAVKESHSLSNLSTGMESTAFKDQITSFSSNLDGQTVVLTTPDHGAGKLHLLPTLNAPKSEHRALQLTLNGTSALERGSEQVDAKAVGLDRQKLLVADREGQVFVGTLPQGDGHRVELTPLHSPDLEGSLGKGHHTEGFVSNGEGSLHAVVKDAQGHKHLAAPAAEGGGFKPGWNLSDSLVVDHKMGLLHVAPPSSSVMNMGRFGMMALHEGKVHYVDSVTRSWTPTTMSADRLKRGLDNQPYVLHDGQLKALSINQKADSVVHGDSNVFALSHARNAPKSGDALPGLGKDSGAVAVAVLNANRFISANKEGDIQLHQVRPGTQRESVPALGLPKDGLTGEIRDLALDRESNLFALNKEGALFTLPREAWQNDRAESSGTRWQPVETPQGCKADRLDTTPEHDLLVHQDDRHQRLTQGGWTEHRPNTEITAPQPREAETVYQRLGGATKAVSILGTGLTAKLDTQVLGQMAQENKKTSSGFVDRMRANVIKLPAELGKSVGDGIQHHFKGRAGLHPLYSAQASVFKRLEVLNTQRQQSPQANSTDLKTKLSQLNLGEAGKPLMAALHQFHQDLERSSGNAALLLGKHQGLINAKGEINHQFTPSALKSAIQGMNSHRSGKSLSDALMTATLAHPSSADSKASALLKQFVIKKVDMSYQSDKVVQGAHRDVHDEMALTKSRLALDTLTIGDLHGIVDKLAGFSGASPTKADLKPMQEALTLLRDHQYGDHNVKRATDMGFTRFSALEADYDAVKTFTRAFKDERHAVSVTSRTSLQAEDQGQLTQKMKDTVLSLNAGESISFNRSYNAGLSSVYVMPTQLAKVTINHIPSPLIASGGVTGERGYSLSFSRGDNGIDVSFGRTGGLSAKAGVIVGHEPKATKENLILDDDHTLTFDLRMGVSGSATIGATRQNGLSFTLSEKELPSFIDELTQGKINPLDLMKKGTEHQVKQGLSVNFDVDGAFTLDGRAAVNMTDNDNKTFSTTTRASLGVSGGVNVLSASHDHSTVRGELNEKNTTSNNRVRFFNQASVGANAALWAGMATTQPGKGTLPAGFGTGASATLSVDTKTSHSISLNVKVAEPLQKSDIEELTASLEKHFGDVETQQLLGGVNKLDDIDEQLAIMNRHFDAKTPRNDGQYSAMQSLGKAVRQQSAAKHQAVTLSSVSHSASYANLSKLDSNGVLHALRKLVNDNLPPTNAERIHAFMNADPALKAVMTHLQSLPNASASVSLEPKDAVKEQVEKGIQNNSLSKQAIIDLFKDSNNLRIGSISFTETVKKKEGFTFPTPIVGASSSVDVSMSKSLGEIHFSYGQNQDTPRHFSLEGEIARANPTLAQALDSLHQEGITLAKH